MTMIEIILAVTITSITAYSVLNGEKDKIKIEQGSMTKTTLYWHTIMLLWGSCAVLVIAMFYQGHFVDIQLLPKNDWLSIGVAMVAIAVSLYLVIAPFLLKLTEEERSHTANEMEELKWFLPETRQQNGVFSYMLSPTAGICEEFLYRGVLLTVLTSYFGGVAAIILSSVAFALPHLYQGLNGLVKAFLMGLVFGVIYWATGSLLVVILLHAAVDFYSGNLSYLVYGDDMETKLNAL